jgi:hypothetical protein
MSTLLKAIASLRPGVDCADTDGTLEGLRWDTKGVTPPTQKDVDDEIAKQEAHGKRCAEYPSIGDQLDALWKGGKDADDMKAVIMAVKARNPVPK